MGDKSAWPSAGDLYQAITDAAMRGDRNEVYQTGLHAIADVARLTAERDESDAENDHFVATIERLLTERDAARASLASMTAFANRRTGERDALRDGLRDCASQWRSIARVIRSHADGVQEAALAYEHAVDDATALLSEQPAPGRKALIREVAQTTAEYIGQTASLPGLCDCGAKSVFSARHDIAEAVVQMFRDTPHEGAAPTEGREREALCCEKCGGLDIGTAYRAAGDRLDSGFGFSDRTASECLRRFCRTCRYAWTDPVLSSAPPPAQPSGDDDTQLQVLLAPMEAAIRANDFDACWHAFTKIRAALRGTQEGA
jgi:hypothetical protein